MVDEVLHRGEFCFRDDCALDIVSWEDGTKRNKNFKAGKYYWIDTITHYADGYSDIKFYDGYTLHQIKLNELGHFLGKPEVITTSEIIPESKSAEIIPESKASPEQKPEKDSGDSQESDGWFSSKK